MFLIILCPLFATGRSPSTICFKPQALKYVGRTNNTRCHFHYRIVPISCTEKLIKDGLWKDRESVQGVH
jgi:hypothetical protein